MEEVRRLRLELSKVIKRKNLLDEAYIELKREIFDLQKKQNVTLKESHRLGDYRCELLHKIGRTKGLHCPARKYTRDPWRESYECLIREMERVQIGTLYDAYCSNCKLSQDKIVVKVLAHKLEKREEE